MDEFKRPYDDDYQWEREPGETMMSIWDGMTKRQRTLCIVCIMAVIGFIGTMMVAYTPTIAQTQNAVKNEKITDLREEIFRWAKMHKLHITIITDCRLRTANRGRLDQTVPKDHCIVSTNPIEPPWIVVCEGHPRVCYRRYWWRSTSRIYWWLSLSWPYLQSVGCLCYTTRNMFMVDVSNCWGTWFPTVEWRL